MSQAAPAQRSANASQKQDLTESLYKQLAKVLHPDLEIDSTLKAHKEEWMKRLTTAYSSGDLRELLSIELEWLGEESSNLAQASDEKRKIYCLVLKEQIQEVKAQTEQLVNGPEYFVLQRFAEPFTGYIPEPRFIKPDMLNEIESHRDLLDVLQRGGSERRNLVNQWADRHALAQREMGYPF